MRTFIAGVTLALALTPSLAFAHFYRGPAEAPPPPRAEVVHVRTGYVWVGGHHAYHHGRYHWTRGHYVRERRGWTWRDGDWNHRDRSYEWHPGHWERR